MNSPIVFGSCNDVNVQNALDEDRNPVNFTILREKAILEGINGFAICAYHNCLSQIVQRTFTYQKISKILSV